MWLSPDSMLQLSILLPVLATVGIIAAGAKPNLRETISLTAGLLQFYLVVNLYLAFKHGDVASVLWFELLPGLEIKFRIEALGVIFSLVASFLWPVTTLYSIGYMRAHKETNQTRFYVYFAIAISCVMGAAYADNLFTLFIFYELLTLSTYPLVAHAGTESAKRGARTYIVILLGTSFAFFLLAMIGTWLLSGTLDFKHGGVFSEDTSSLAMAVLLVLFIFGIGKAAIMPFHRWLPAAMVAPTPVSALLHAVAVVKVGVFTLLKVCVFIFGMDLLAILPTTQGLMYLAGATVLIASLIAMRQDNLKARLAYSTISQLNYITVGALMATGSSLTGSAMHIAMHAFGKITLFFCAGAILVAAHQMPITMAAFFIGSLSIIGVPPGGGTWSKWYLMTGTLDAGQWILMGVLMISALLNIAYLLPIPVRAFFPGKNNQTFNTGVREAPLPSLIALSITALGCIALFLFPQSLYELADAFWFSPGFTHGP